jgi:hypothetical protein
MLTRSWVKPEGAWSGGAQHMSWLPADKSGETAVHVCRQQGVRRVCSSGSSPPPSPPRLPQDGTDFKQSDHAKPTIRGLLGKRLTGWQLFSDGPGH